MRIHILGICGTFMAGIAVLAKQLGYEVSGSDTNIYPPMSSQLKSCDIKLFDRYDVSNLKSKPDLIIVGNAISRGNVEIEAVLNENIPFISGPEWLFDHVLKERHVLAVAGTHGKTTTSSMLAWILEHAGLNPGFLIGGVLENFGVSARLTDSKFFVIEADEYDTAFFDKRSKFVHYHPDTLILNNLEYDHADIFNNLDEIKKQFHYLVRTVPGNGDIVVNAKDKNLTEVLEKGCWSSVDKFNDKKFWHAEKVHDGSTFDVFYKEKLEGRVAWQLLGEHNVENALAAIAAAKHLGVKVKKSTEAFSEFKNVKRRLEVKLVGDISVYDDFAHHPTAIKKTLAGLRAKVGKEKRIIAVVELGSRSMKMGIHRDTLLPALIDADIAFIKKPIDALWDVAAMAAEYSGDVTVCADDEILIQKLKAVIQSGDHVIVMSNTGFNKITEHLA